MNNKRQKTSNIPVLNKEENHNKSTLFTSKKPHTTPLK